MRHTTLLLGALLLCPVVAHAQADVSAAVTLREQDMWRFVKEKNPAAFRANIDSTLYTGIYWDGRRGPDTDEASYHWTSLDTYTLSEMVAKPIDSLNVMLTYKATLRGRAVGVPVQGPYWMSTLWHLRNGQWLAVFHSEIKVPR